MSFEKDTYRPLPKGLTIKESKIDGLGLHASMPHSAGTKFGETHVLVHSRDRHEWVRTPLGGFINHSNNPNCFITTEAGDRTLYDLKPIKKGHSFKQKNYPHFKVELFKCSPFDSLLIHFETQNTTLDSLIHTYKSCFVNREMNCSSKY